MKNILFIAIFLTGTFSSCEKISPSEIEKFDRKWTKETSFTFSDISGIIQNGKAWIQLDTLFHIVDVKDGKTIKTVSSGQESSLAGSRNMIYDSGNIYVHSVPDVSCYNFDTGELIWRFEIPEGDGAVLLTEMKEDKTKLYVAFRGGCYIIDKLSGALIDRIDLVKLLCLDTDKDNLRIKEIIKINELQLAFAVHVSQDTVISDFVTVVDIAKKEPLWKFSSESDTTSGGTVYFPTINKMVEHEDKLIFTYKGVTVVSKEDGSVIWENEYEDLGFTYGLEVNDQGTVFIGSTAFTIELFALNIEDGSEIWHRTLDGGSVRFIEKIDDDIVVRAGKLYFIEQSSGKIHTTITGDTDDLFFTNPILGDSCFISVSSERIYCHSY